MLDSRLHAFGRNSPLRGPQIKLPPARLAKFPWPYKEEEGELQGDADDFAAPPVPMCSETSAFGNLESKGSIHSCQQ